MSNLHSFVLYAPDYTDEGALQRRLAVRSQHFATAHELRGKGVYGLAGGLLSPDGVGAVDPAQKLIGSMIIVNAESLEQARKIAESDIYWTAGVWDKERTTIVPFLTAFKSEPEAPKADINDGRVTNRNPGDVQSHAPGGSSASRLNRHSQVHSGSGGA